MLGQGGGLRFRVGTRRAPELAELPSSHGFPSSHGLRVTLLVCRVGYVEAAPTTNEREGGTVWSRSVCVSGVAFALVSVPSVGGGLVKLSERFERAMRAADAVDAAVDAGVTFSPELVWACQRAHGAKLADVVAELGRR